MPSKKKKYNARFPAGRIKKIMQTDEEVGKVAQAVPIIISRTLELFVESLLTKSMTITQARNAKTLTPSHMKQCILSESRFDFLKDLVKNIPDASVQEDNDNNAIFEENLTSTSQDSPQEPSTSTPPSTTPAMPSLPSHQLPPPPLFRAPPPANFYSEQAPGVSGAPVAGRTPVIQFVPKGAPGPPTSTVTSERQNLHIKIASEALAVPQVLPIAKDLSTEVPAKLTPAENVPPLVPISNYAAYTQNSSGDNLCIDEDYDN